MTQTRSLAVSRSSSPAPQDDPAAYIREPFVTLAAAFPSAKSDETYWTLLARTFAEVPDAYLIRAVHSYIDKTEYHVLPTVGQLKKLIEGAKYSLAAAASSRVDEIAEAYVRLTQQRKDALIRAINPEARRVVESVLEHCFRLAPSYAFALAMIPRYLNLADGPELGEDIGYSPTAVLVDSLIPTPAQYAAFHNKPYPAEDITATKGRVMSFDLDMVPPPPVLKAKGIQAPFSVPLAADSLDLTRYVTTGEAFDEWAKTQAASSVWGN